MATGMQDFKRRLENKGVLGVAGENIGDMAARIGGGVGAAHEAARTLTSGAMEGTGKLLFGRGNKPFTVDADIPASTPVATPTPAKAFNPALGTKVNLGGTMAEQGIKPTTDTLNAMPQRQVLADKPVINPLPQPQTNFLIPNQVKGLPAGVTKSLNANGNVLYADAANQASANTAQNQQAATVRALSAQAQATKLPENQVRQLYRELPVDAVSAAGMGGTTPQQRYAAQQQQSTMPADDSIFSRPLRAAPIQQGSTPLQDEIAKQLQVINSNMGHGGIGADQKAAQHALDALLGKDTANQAHSRKGEEMAQQGAQFGQELAYKKKAAEQEGYRQLLEGEQKSALLQSEANKNNAYAQHLLTPAPVKQAEPMIKELNGQLMRINADGTQGYLPKDQSSLMLDDYRKSAELLSSKYDPESDAYVAKLNELENDPNTKQLRKLGLI